MQRTGYWVPIFPREKADGGECRLITNFRELNKHMSVPHHRAENWKNVLRVLKQGDLQWGIVLDMKSWFHNLSIHKKLGRWMRFSHLGRYYQIVGMPFGWSASPWWSAKLAKPIRAWLHTRSWPHLWWVDDVLLLGRTQEETELRAGALIRLLTGLGIKCNKKKSMKKASQEVTYVGHVFHLKEGLIRPVEEKRTLTLKMVKKQLKSHTVVAQWLAALAGNLLDSCKSNVAIEGLAQQLMREAAKVIKEVKWRLGPFAPVPRIWRTSVPKSSLCVSILQAIQVGLESPCPRVFRARPAGARFVVTSDASLQGWGALLTLNGRDIDWTGGLWQTKELQSHITHLEAAGSARAIMTFLPHLGRGDVVHLLTDASSTMFAWLKGSKLVAMNSLILEAKMALHRKGVFATFGHIPGKENCTADWISRNHHRLDPSNYRIHSQIFWWVCRHFSFRPQVDLFASFLNHHLRHYCSALPDKRSWGDAFLLSWQGVLGWAHPPWNLVGRMLEKVEEDKATVLVCFPLWRSAPWWGKFQELLCGPMLTVQGRRLFTGPQGQSLPIPRWPTVFGVLRG